MSSAHPGIDVLISEADLRARIGALGAEITRDYGGRPLVVIGVLKGSFIFLADIVDTGLTMKYLLENLGTRRPATIRIAALLGKPARAKVKIPIDYRGFV